MLDNRQADDRIRKMHETYTTVVFPVSFQFGPDTFGLTANEWWKLSKEQKQERIKEHASYLLMTSQVEPVIHWCDNKNLAENS